MRIATLKRSPNPFNRFVHGGRPWDLQPKIFRDPIDDPGIEWNPTSVYRSN